MRNSQDRIISKRNILIFAFVINVAGLVTLSFFRIFWVYACFGMLSTLIMLPFVATNNFVSHKLSTLLVIFSFPIYGIVMYIFTKSKAKYLFGRRQWQTICFNSNDFAEDDETVMENLNKFNHISYKISKFNLEYFGARVYQNTTSRYIFGVKKYYDELFNELKQAKKYIFIDAYKISEGEIWNELFDILKQKAREGVEVRILYNPKTNKDSFTDKFTYKKLVNYKIEAMPFRSSLYGFSSHRKFFVVDGVVAFVGGANISDNQASVTAEYGNWHQSGVKLTGDAVWNIATLFLNSWQFAKGKNNIDYLNYKPEKITHSKSNEFVQPLSISPLSNRNEVRDLFVSLINNTQHTVSISGSCFMLDSKICEVLANAVKSGVTVNLLVSNVEDKYRDNVLSRGYYAFLIRSGVNIYECQSGAVRSKIVSIDGQTVVIGGTNLDVRKLEARFDCSVLIHNKEIAKSVDTEIANLMKSCKLLTLKDVKSDPLKERMKAGFYKFFTM